MSDDVRGLLRRRDFLVRGAAVLGATAAGGAAAVVAARELASGPEEASAGDDLAQEAEFELDPEYVHLTSFLLAPHPRAVREAIEEHRRALDANPKVYLFERELELEGRVLEEAGKYLGVSPREVALTDSTTMGLGLVYGSFRLAEGEEIVTTEHDHYATHESLRLRAERTGARIRRIPLYGDLGAVSVEEIVEAVRRAVRPATRLVAVTWVHSSTGLKLPIREIADALAEANRDRGEDERVLLAVDGVHGLGVEDVSLPDLGCDIFVAGCHKWLFGPRGTGVVWATEEAWRRVSATIPTFDGRSYIAWIEGHEPTDLPPAAAMTPGGFHSFEHRWALADAFAAQTRLGAGRVAAHTRDLAGALKDGLLGTAGVVLRTPRDDRLSAGIVCFEAGTRPAPEVVDRLQSAHRVIASVTPYREQYVRLGPSLVNSAEDVEAALDAVRALV